MGVSIRDSVKRGANINRRIGNTFGVKKHFGFLLHREGQEQGHPDHGADPPAPLRAQQQHEKPRDGVHPVVGVGVAILHHELVHVEGACSGW